MGVVPRLHALIADHSGMLRLPISAVFAALLVAVTLGLAPLGGHGGWAAAGTHR
jgi:hypothetical protein